VLAPPSVGIAEDGVGQDLLGVVGPEPFVDLPGVSGLDLVGANPLVLIVQVLMVPGAYGAELQGC